MSSTLNFRKLAKKLEQKKEFAVIESVKAAFDIYAPASGEVVEINKELEDAPECINEDPYGAGWIVKILPSDPSELKNLMSVEEYRANLEAEAEA